MSWKIVSRITDTYDFAEGTQHEYIVYVRDDANRNIEARQAYGIYDRSKVTKELLDKYHEYGIVKVEHQDH